MSSNCKECINYPTCDKDLQGSDIDYCPDFDDVNKDYLNEFGCVVGGGTGIAPDGTFCGEITCEYCQKYCRGKTIHRD